MIIKCIEDRSWDKQHRMYTRDKCVTITKGNIYKVLGTIKLDNNLHYIIKTKNGFVGQYFYTRFEQISFKQLKLI